MYQSSADNELLELPPGRLRKHDEYICTCPFCGKDEHFDYNIDRNYGHCYRCKRAVYSHKQFIAAFKYQDLSLYERPESVIKRYKQQNPMDRCCAWDHDESNLFCRKKGYTELHCRIHNLEYDPGSKEMYVEIDSLSADLPRSFLYRPLFGPEDKQKWLYPSNLEASYYGWNVRPFEGSGRNVLLCEGISDLLCTELWPYGIAILGSNPKRCWGWWLKRNVGKVFLWFDADRAGWDAEAKCAAILEQYSVPYECIRTQRDPKEYLPVGDQNLSFLNSLKEKLIG